jgi:hypothetical protein
MCSEVGISKDIRCGTNIEEVELLTTIFNNRGTRPVRIKVTFNLLMAKMERSDPCTFKKNGATTKRSILLVLDLAIN